jgi:hypothetical protein
MRSPRLPRRRWLKAAASLPLLWNTRSGLAAGSSASPLDDRIVDVTRETIFRGSLGADGKPLGKTWFSTRCGLIPAAAGAKDRTPTAVMLMAEIGGSDYFGPVQETVSQDLGRTWSEPQPVPGLGRTPLDDGQGTEATVCDMVPEYHAPTGTMLAMGHDVFYRGGKFFRDQPPRHSVYLVRRPDCTWSKLQRMPWDDPRGKFIYTCNCAQRVTLPGGDVLVPLSVGATSAARSVVVVRCGFDGERLTIRETSNELKNHVGRGLLEPSLAAFGGRTYLTLRAENNRGYISTSDDDGRTWSTPVAWQFDDAEKPIEMSTTQQRWLVGADALYLVYTRRDPTNESVMRWRAPLFAARVDPKSLHLVHGTERVVVPLVGDGARDGKNVPHLGNFHVNPVSRDESWVTVGDYSVRTFRGDVTLARVKWGAV